VKIRNSISLILAPFCLFLGGCFLGDPALKGRILLPLRVCVVQGSSLTAQQDGSFSNVGNDKIDTTVAQADKDLNEKVWIPGAAISFYTAVYESLQGPAFNVPVIADPQPPPPPGHHVDFQNYGPGRLGDIDAGDRDIGPEETEMSQAYQACLNAWSLGNNAKKTGTIVVIARRLVNDVGLITQIIGRTSSHQDTVFRNNGMDLCVVPRHLVVGDVANLHVVLTEPSQMQFPQYFYLVLAHELGHTLLLSHGDGQPNGGTLPPDNGPRKFDDDCGGTNIGVSLMSPGANSNLITVLQRELARDAAVLVPGHSGPL
jgi:hypothetical protein